MARHFMPLLLLLVASRAAADLPPISSAWQSVVITEVMVAPVGAAPGAGQWIEVHNPGTAPVNLQGMVLSTASGGLHVISPANDLVLDPGAFLVMGRSADAVQNGGVDVGYEYLADVLMDADHDVVMLRQAGNFVDVFGYGNTDPTDLAVKQGATFSLEPAQAGQSVKSWCYGRVIYGTAGDKGTPGKPNTYCDDDKDGYAEDQGDCNDDDPSVHPGATEVCNGVDDDCNGLTDDGAVGAPDCLSEGVCAGTVAACKGKAGWLCPYPPTYEAVETLCDGLDNDCDGAADNGLEPPPTPCLSQGVCKGATWVCTGAGGFSCSYPNVYEAVEASCDGLDNDCNGRTDEGFDPGRPCVSGTGACARTGEVVCSADHAGTTCSAAAGEPTTELCGDGIDNDCNGLTDEGFPVGLVCTVGTGACTAAGKYGCTDDRLAVKCLAVPGAPTREVCGDGIDNDCDGETDEADCEWPSRPGGGCDAGSRPTAPCPLPAIVLAAVLAFVTTRRAASTPGRAPWRRRPRQPRG